MSMFDWVRYSCDCPSCGADIRNFQSHDGPCHGEFLSPDDVSEFDGFCDCGAWLQFRRQPDRSYHMRWTRSGPANWSQFVPVQESPSP